MTLSFGSSALYYNKCSAGMKGKAQGIVMMAAL